MARVKLNDEAVDVLAQPSDTDWQRRVVGRSLQTATKRSIDRGAGFIRAAATLLERSNGEGFTVQDVADETGQSLRTLYQYFESKDDLLLAVFEEAMKTYAQMIRTAIADLDEPVERLAGAVIAAARMPERSASGVDRGLARLRLKLGEVDPELVARSQEPITTLFRDLVADAVAGGTIRDCDADHAAYMITSLKSAFVISHTLGNDTALRLPDAMALTAFCLDGLSASRSDGWLAGVAGKIRMSPSAEHPGVVAAGRKRRARTVR